MSPAPKAQSEEVPYWTVATEEAGTSPQLLPQRGWEGAIVARAGDTRWAMSQGWNFDLQGHHWK